MNCYGRFYHDAFLLIVHTLFLRESPSFPSGGTGWDFWTAAGSSQFFTNLLNLSRACCASERCVKALPVLCQSNFACWSYRAARDTSQGNELSWQNHRLTKMMCFKSPLDCKGESISFFQSCWGALFCMGGHPASVLLCCMFVKKAERRRRKQTFLHLRFSPEGVEFWMTVEIQVVSKA